MLLLWVLLWLMLLLLLLLLMTRGTLLLCVLNPVTTAFFDASLITFVVSPTIFLRFTASSSIISIAIISITIISISVLSISVISISVIPTTTAFVSVIIALIYSL